MAEIAVKNRISNFQGLVTLTLDRVIPHAVVHHSSTSTYKPNFIEIEETFMDVQSTYVNKLAPYGTDSRLLLTANFKVT